MPQSKYSIVTELLFLRFVEHEIMRLTFLFTLLILCSICALAQDVTGIWRGTFTSVNGDQYRLEFQVKQENTNHVTGVSYSYLDVRFYGKAIMTGNFSKSRNVLNIQEIRTVELKMSSFSVACIMKYNLEYSRSGNEEFLEGTFTSKYEKSDSFFGIREGADCGGGTVYLRKVPTSDFYVEPFLRDKPVSKNTIPNNTTNKVGPLVKKNNTTTKPVVKQPVKPSVKVTPKTDTITRVNETIDNPVTIEKKTIPTPQVLRTRENELAKTILVNTNKVTIKLYDNGEIDDDTISIYIDKQLVLSRQRLSTVPITLTLEMGEGDNAEHEVVMVAENLGKIPPNTSLMIIDAGEKRYQVQITSTEQKNAMVRFKYQKPSAP